jgi:hypothetical protein
MLLVVIVLSLALSVESVLLLKRNITIYGHQVQKRWGGTTQDVRSFVTANLKDCPRFTDAVSAFNWMETFGSGYEYVLDDYSLVAPDGKKLENSNDFWLYAQEEMSFLEERGYFLGDCDKGAILLCSILLTNDISAYVAVGTVTVRDNVTKAAIGTYGHAWVVVLQDSKRYYLETTLGTATTAMSPASSDYNMYYMFDDKSVVSGEFSIASPLDPSPAPKMPEMVLEIFRLSQSSGTA